MKPWGSPLQKPPKRLWTPRLCELHQVQKGPAKMWDLCHFTRVPSNNSCYLWMWITRWISMDASHGCEEPHKIGRWWQVLMSSYSFRCVFWVVTSNRKHKKSWNRNPMPNHKVLGWSTDPRNWSGRLTDVHIAGNTFHLWNITIFDVWLTIFVASIHHFPLLQSPVSAAQIMLSWRSSWIPSPCPSLPARRSPVSTPVKAKAPCECGM